MSRIEWNLLKRIITCCCLIISLCGKAFCYHNFSEVDSIPKREFRGVWVATINNIDWPSERGLSPENQQREFIKLVKYCKNLGMNALIVQIRPSADALYASNIEPWSFWLTGKQGQAPEPYYDPLTFMIETCRQHDIEFHAWLNPFRSVQSKYMKVDDSHISKKFPEWHFSYNSTLLLNPGLPAVRNYLYEIIEDILTRYPIDAIHFDDYFYPYPVRGEKIDDIATYKFYNLNGLSLADWRRSNINIFIKEVSELIKKVNPQVKFGISPPGIWRNAYNDINGSDTKGLAAYDDLYADSRLWVKEGWVDYIIPQIYWDITHKVANYETLVEWWQKQIKNETQLYVGHAAYKVDNSQLKAWKDGLEINRQIAVNRHSSQIDGSAFFSANSLIKNSKNFANLLNKDFYQYQVLRPNNPNGSPIAIAPKKLSKIKTDKGFWLQWQEHISVNQNKTTSLGYLLYRFPDTISQINFEDTKYLLKFFPKSTQHYHDTTSHQNYTYYVTAYNKFHNESIPAYQLFEDTTKISINNVVVGFGTALIDATFKANLKKGDNRIVIPNLPFSFINESFNLEVSEKVNLTSLKILDDTLHHNEFDIVQDSLLNYLNNQIMKVSSKMLLKKDSIATMKETEEMIKLNKTMAVEETSVKSLKEMDAYITSRLLTIRAEKRRLQQEINQLTKKLTLLKSQKNGYLNMPIEDKLKSKCIHLDINSIDNGYKTFEISFQVTNVDWKPNYRLYYNKFNNKVSIDYLASTLQKSGQNWENVPLSVSSKLVKGIKTDSSSMYPAIFKVAPLNVNLPHSNTLKKILLSQDKPKYKIDLIAKAGNDTSPIIQLTLTDATKHEWYPGEMEVFIDKNLEKNVAFNPKPLHDTLSIFLGRDTDILLKTESIYDSLKNKVIFKTYKHNERLVIQNKKSRKVAVSLTRKAIAHLKNKRSTKFFNQAVGSFNFSKQHFFWQIELAPQETKEIILTYSYNKGLFNKAKK